MHSSGVCRPTVCLITVKVYISSQLATLVLCGCLQWNGDLSSSEIDTQVSGKPGLRLSDVVGIQSALEQLFCLESSPPASSSASSSSDVASEQLLDRSKKATSKGSTVMVVNPARYKTELCRQFEEHGSCRYGDKCQFAHGIVELRTLVRHPKYKTEMCRTFHTTGFCPYGLRCHFIHNDDERRVTAVLDSTGRRCSATAHVGPASPPSLSTLTADGLLVGQPPQSQCRPIFRSSSSISPTSTTAFFTPEVDSEQRGRPILARGSTLPERSSLTYPYVDQQVSFLSIGDPRVTSDLITTVRAPCA